jgi:hypothetical protein
LLACEQISTKLDLLFLPLPEVRRALTEWLQAIHERPDGERAALPAGVALPRTISSRWAGSSTEVQWRRSRSSCRRALLAEWPQLAGSEKTSNPPSSNLSGEASIEKNFTGRC